MSQVLLEIWIISDKILSIHLSIYLSIIPFIIEITRSCPPTSFKLLVNNYIALICNYPVLNTPSIPSCYIPVDNWNIKKKTGRERLTNRGKQARKRLTDFILARAELNWTGVDAIPSRAKTFEKRTDNREKRYQSKGKTDYSSKKRVESFDFSGGKSFSPNLWSAFLGLPLSV